MKRKQFHIMRQWLCRAETALGIHKKANKPHIIIVSSDEILDAAAVYDYASNTIKFADFMGDKETVLEYQKNDVMPQMY